jgi:hypothetical protein
MTTFTSSARAFRVALVSLFVFVILGGTGHAEIYGDSTHHDPILESLAPRLASEPYKSPVGIWYRSLARPTSS